MKDPLDKRKTFYEILDIPYDTRSSQLTKAYRKAAIAKKHKKNEIRKAHKKLSDPVDRTFEDLFLYNDHFLEKLQFNKNDNSQLLSKRNELAKEWWDIQKKRFPNYNSAHSLALLWYYWTMYYEEEQLAKIQGRDFKKIANLPKTPPSKELWSNTISNWAHLLNSKDFWTYWVESKKEAGITLSKNDIDTLTKKVNGHFFDIFQNFCMKHKENSQKYKDYEHMFSTENKTARQLSEAGLQIPKEGRYVNISCGQIMLEQIEKLDYIRQQLNSLKIRYVNNPSFIDKVNNLLNTLSPYYNISFQIDKGRCDEAIKLIEKLPPSEQNKKEVLQLLAKAYSQKGEKLLSLDKYSEAFKIWEKSINTGKKYEEQQEKTYGITRGSFYGEIKKQIVSKAEAKAASLQNKDPDNSIYILESAIKLVQSTELKETLANIYNLRGLMSINEAYDHHKKGKKQWTGKDGKTKKLKTELEKGVKDLKKAVEINPANAKYKKDLEQFEKIFSNLGLGEEHSKAIKLANDATKIIEQKGNINNANQMLAESITILEELKRKNPLNQRINTDLEQIKKIKKTAEVIIANKSITEKHSKAIKLANDASKIIQQRGNINNANQMLAESISILEELKRKNPSNQRINSDLEQINKVKKTAETIIINKPVNEEHSRAIQLANDAVKIVEQRGNIQEAKNKLIEAYTILMKLSRENPFNNRIKSDLDQIAKIAAPFIDPSYKTSSGSSSYGKKKRRNISFWEVFWWLIVGGVILFNLIKAIF